MTNYLPGNRFHANILLYVLLVKGSSENDQKGPKSKDANFLKFILGNSGDNIVIHMFAQERSFYNFLRYNKKTTTGSIINPF